MREQDERWRLAFHMVDEDLGSCREAWLRWAGRRRRRGEVRWCERWPLKSWAREAVAQARLADALAWVRELEGRLQTRTECTLAAQRQCRECEYEYEGRAAELERDLAHAREEIDQLRAHPAAIEQPAPQGHGTDVI
jgi:hypothetical protein